MNNILGVIKGEKSSIKIGKGALHAPCIK